MCGEDYVKCGGVVCVEGSGAILFDRAFGLAHPRTHLR